MTLIREFKYIIFNNIKEEVEFSHNIPFEIAEIDKWEKYLVTYKEDFQCNTFMFMKFIIEGEEIELQLDTGSGRGIVIGEAPWEKIKN